MSYALPGIIFDTATGSLELVENNVSGYVVKNRSKEVMAKKIINLLENKKELKKMGLVAKETSKKYSFDEIKNKWLNFLDNVLKDNGDMNEEN